MCVVFSERVIRNHRGPVWRAVTTPLSFLYYFSTSNTIHAFFIYIYMLKLKLNARSANKSYVTYEPIILEQFNSKSPPPTTDG